MIEQGVSFAVEARVSNTQLLDACAAVGDQLQGRGRLAPIIADFEAVAGLAGELTLPDYADVGPRAMDRLAEIAEQSYAATVGGHNFVARVFPEDEAAVRPDALDVECMSLAQYRKASGLERWAATALYRQHRDAAEAALRGELNGRALRAPEMPVDDAAVAEAYEDVVLGLAVDVEAAVGYIKSQISAPHFAAIRQAMRQVMIWKEGNTSSIDNIKRHTDKVREQLGALVADPADFLVGRITEQLAAAHQEQGVHFGEQTVRGVTVRHVRGLNVRLIDSLKHAEVPVERYVETPATSKRRLTVVGRQTEKLVTSNDIGTESAARPVSGFKSVGAAEMTAPWLKSRREPGDEPVRRNLVWFTDALGNRVLAVRAQSVGCLAVERASGINSGHHKTDFVRMWEKVLSKSTDGDLTGMGHRAFGSQYSTPQEQYDAVRFFYERQLGGAGLRLFYGLAEAARIVSDSSLDSLGLTGKEPVVALLGRCVKHLEDDIINQLLVTNRRAPRVAGGK